MPILDVDPNLDDELVEDPDVAAADEDLDEVPAPAVLRSKHYKPGHRQPRATTEKPIGTSPWVNAPREGFTAMQTKRREEMNTKEGRSVSGGKHIGS